ncbi:class I poly(R)-hydroxyalkanoic acid synthase [Sphingomonas donggukensis]|uniref:Class I poly(R)-hydroxyalkanoic acid synthase n=1 Tax=Sphingomonas donggukensis TaxID=2949093 RepID=A0ABY4U0J9_9SPHN|nr:alpha/beta fold hydrolase [Sphingomonas donggukensis]URW76093.1 class I poly(R)-hydroxyalkanoic acid synthase [Sphingomonas donggukensis]
MTDPWTQAMQTMTAAMRRPVTGAATRPYDPLALFESMARFGASFDPAQVFALQVDAAREWSAFWANVWTPVADKPKDRRFAAPAWQEDAWFRAIRDGYLLASAQMRRLVAQGDGDAKTQAMANFLLDGWLNAVAPTNFAMTNPAVIEKTIATGGANLMQGFANLMEDVTSGKGIVTRRTDPDAFVKGETIAATPGQVVWQNDLCQLIQYTPTTPDVAAEPLLYVPPLVNRFYMIDLQPKSSLVKWLVDQGRTVFVVSWVNPTEAHRDKGVEDYVLDGIVAAIGVVRQRTGATPDLFAFCLGGTLVAIALAYLAAKGRSGEVNSATLIGSMVDFADMRDWSAFVHEAHLTALEGHLERQGFIDSVELQQLFAAMRANDLIWSSVVNHYLLDQAAPPSDLLYWFEDGARIPAKFLTSYNRRLLYENALARPAGFEVGGVAIDLAAVATPVLSIALKDDHVSAWSAVYDGSKLLRADFILGGSGHNAGVINPPAANRHGYWTGSERPATAADWLESATRHEGSWWPHWIGWLEAHGTGKQVPARVITDGIEPAPGSYAKTA